MNAAPSKIQKTDLTTAYALAEPLDCLDGKPADVEPGQALSAMPSSPAAAVDQPENVDDQPAGLCGSALEVLLVSMRQAKEVLGQAMRRQ